MYEKEKRTVRHELNAAFQQAKANQRRMNETTMVASEENDVLKQDLKASRRQVKKLTEGLEEVGEKFKGVIKAKHEKVRAATREERTRARWPSSAISNATNIY